MLRHSDVWLAIDRLAREYGYSASGLARRSGLDPTTFNKSKRITREGKLRWPSTESIAKILTATSATLGEFVSYVGDNAGAGVYRNIPLIGYSQAGGEDYFDASGRPVGDAWDEIPFPGLGDPSAFGLEISGDTLEPVYRDGDILVVSPQAGVRRGDRVVTRTREGEVMARLLIRQSARRVELRSLNLKRGNVTISVENLEWMNRIVWATQ